MAYRYEGFWRAMDTLRDRQVLEEMMERGDMPWHLNNNNVAGVVNG
jgi:glucose-1-phosphate cytidylyltransferase